MKKRETWLDIAKGIGIIAVVTGHAGNPIAHHYLFWFHMPLFFIISGYLFKDVHSFQEFKYWIKKRTFQLLVPYASFGITLSIILFLKDLSLPGFFINILKIAYGGELLVGFYGVFWFVTCLYLTQILFTLIRMTFKQIYIQVSLIALFYFSAHIISILPLLKDIKFPWNMDVVFLSIIYYAIGFYGKDYLKTIIHKTSTLMFTFSLAVITILFELNSLFHFELDMKKNIYSNIALDVLIPVIFSMCIFTLSYRLSLIGNKIFLENLGTTSLTIMYLHFPINIILFSTFGDYHFIIYSLVGILFPLAIYYFVLEKFKITKKLFLGIPPTNTSQSSVIKMAA